MNMEFTRKLPIPQEIKKMYPAAPEDLARKAENDRAIQQIFTGQSKKLLLVIGPCSADNETAVLDYMHRLRGLQEQVQDKIVMVPRLYTNKPRTTGEGYKGMLHQPDPNERPDLLKGVVAIRSLHLHALAQTGFSCADEMLYPDNHRYLSDLLSYVAIGARSVENQQHRLTASGLDIPVGMKNPTSGNIAVMMNSIKAAQHGHTFIYRGWEVTSKGNPLAHAILRGYVNKHGQSLPNYHYEDLFHLREEFDKNGLQNPAVLVDVNHANSGRRYTEQARIAKEVLQSRRYDPAVGNMVKGLMIESYLVDGNQPVGGGVYGQSITDPCLGWEKTSRLVLELADLL